jgi:Kef-type K+ transport system membrane component KefB
MMIGGVLLGPSVFGYFWPDGQAWVFPSSGQDWWQTAGELGVGGYLFCVGLDFDLSELSERRRLTLAVAGAGVMAPFLLAIPLAVSTRQLPGWFAGDATMGQQVLFLGAALSVTAFPMLVWIIRSKGLTGSPMGLVAISAGAIGDAFAWVILAVVLASFGGNAVIVLRCVLGGILMLGMARYVVPRLLLTPMASCEREGRLTPTALLTVTIIFLVFLTFSSWCGMHAVFGGFLCGLSVPKGWLNQRLRSIEPAVGAWLLPFFFVRSGLQTRLDLLLTPSVLILTALVIMVALLGKAGACWWAARWAGLDSSSAAGVAALMNARGLMELILLNVGVAAGLVGPVLFSCLVVMAIVTTCMAGPLFDWTYGRRARLAGGLGRL